MKEWILRLIVEWLVSNVNKEQIDKLMAEYVMPFLKERKEVLYKWLDDAVKDTESEIDDVLAQIVKHIIDVFIK